MNMYVHELTVLSPKQLMPEIRKTSHSAAKSKEQVRTAHSLTHPRSNADVCL